MNSASKFLESVSTKAKGSNGIVYSIGVVGVVGGRIIYDIISILYVCMDMVIWLVMG